jgi:hypothetical protein
MITENGIFAEYFLIRILINFVSMILLVRVVYYATYQKRDLFFTFFLLNLVVFLLAYMLEKGGGFNSIGSAFGLLAAFSLLRFRTETLSVKNMTYLFIVMTFGLINSIMKATYLEIVLLNLIIVGAVFIIDGSRWMKHQQCKTVEYDLIENVKPEREAELLADLRQRTGIDIRSVTVDHINLEKGKVSLSVFYYRDTDN